MDKLYMNKDEVAIYRDGELHAITRVDKIEKEFIENLKVVFPESDICILGFDELEGTAPRNLLI
jgi:hypothetical protein